jgi:hypothetical protein
MSAARYIRDDGAEMVAVAPHQFVNAALLASLKLTPMKADAGGTA